ncbi:MAG: tRNA pseudouridine(38-40) synthase TruA [Planctomycetota bacterium]|nr:MAG: tRNA pseudouridine(38-40) synthase TruA [Planctomycetota bacterium]
MAETCGTAGARTICLTLAYDGTAYRGWQVQPNGPTVQAALEDAVYRVSGERVRLMAAGRTDAGVHALGQVASFRTRSRIPVVRWRPALQHFLPADIVVRDAREVAGAFHATHSAISKRYRYVIFNGAVRNPFVRRAAWWIAGSLDVPAMDAAARTLVGRHDFASFQSSGSPREDTVRTVFEARVVRCPAWAVWSETPIVPRRTQTGAEDPLEKGVIPCLAPEYGEISANGVHGYTGRSSADPRPGALHRDDVSAVQPAGRDAEAGTYVCLEIEGDGFLYNMVRAVVGTLVRVGRGRWTPTDVAGVLRAKDRRRAAETAPPHGLYLTLVRYPAELLNPGAGD